MLKKLEYREKQMDRRGEAKHADDDTSEGDWKENVLLVEEYKQQSQSFIEMSKQFGAMSDRTSGRIVVAKHGIASKSSSQRPVQPTAYRAGTGVSDFDKREVKRMLAKNVTEPAQIE